MTELDSPVTRVLSLTVDGYPVDVTLSPADPDNGIVQESFVFHKKRTQQYKKVPVALLLRVLGWTDDVTKSEQERQRAEKRPQRSSYETQCPLSERELQELEEALGAINR